MRLLILKAISILAFQAIVDTPQASAQLIRCTDHGWNLDLSGKTLSLTGRAGDRKSGDGVLAKDDEMLLWRGRFSGDAADTVVFFTDRQCSISDGSKGFFGLVSTPKAAFRGGCCARHSDDQYRSSTPVDAGMAVVAGSAERRVNVRRQPRIGDNNVVGVANGQQELMIVGISDETADVPWYQVVFDNGLEGWIRGDLIVRSNVADRQGAIDQTRTTSPRAFGWAADIVALIPGIDGCLRTATSKPALVEYAVRRPSDVVDVRVKDGSNRHWRCLVSPDGGTPIRFDPVIVGRTAADGPIFVRSPATPNADPCTTIDPVIDPNRQLRLGWLVFNSCR